MTGKEMVSLLRREGWALDAISGSHHKLVKGDQQIVVPVHGKRDLPKGLELAILRKAGLR